MTWTCRLVEESAPHKEVGDVWYAWTLDGAPLVGLLSVEYLRDWAGVRPPLVVRLPGRVDVCLDRQVDDEGGHGWVVSGDPPRVSVSPSVNVLGVYHGFVRDGVISPDLQGREYLPDGRPRP
jgi:hypothetical protein